MTKRNHIPIVVTTKDGVSDESVEKYVQAALDQLNDVDEINRVFIASSEMPDEEASRLLDMMDRVDVENIEAASRAKEKLSDGEG